MIYNKAIKFVPAAKSAASTGLPTRCFGIRLWQTVEHKAQVIGTTISHGHGPMTQVLHVKLNNGKELYVNNDGAIIKNGTKVLIIERYRNNNAASIYEFKNKI